LQNAHYQLFISKSCQTQEKATGVDLAGKIIEYLERNAKNA
jgi:hypothetical protein